MHRHSRRAFLVQSAAGAAALSAGGLSAPRLLAADQPAEMAIARWSGPKEMTAEQLQQAAVRLTERAVEAIGGLKRFVSRGSVVWVKPNIGWDRTPETAANTNPDVVATLVRLCFEAGAKKVKVGDNPCDIAQKSYAASGIAAAAKQAGAEVLFLDRSRFRETRIDGERVKSIPVFPEVLECDLVINVPVVKHHRLAIGTLCMKNYMGVIEKRNLFHQAIADCVTDLTRFMKPRICVLDAVRVLTAHGPKGGDLKDVQTPLALAAGTDIVALDAWGAELLGKKPAEIATIPKGQEAGLGKADYRSLAPKEIAVS
jgi:uncharacterized protein (DUF362 family)